MAQLRVRATAVLLLVAVVSTQCVVQVAALDAACKAVSGALQQRELELDGIASNTVETAVLVQAINDHCKANQPFDSGFASAPEFSLKQLETLEIAHTMSASQVRWQINVATDAASKLVTASVTVTHKQSISGSMVDTTFANVPIVVTWTASGVFPMNQPAALQLSGTVTQLNAQPGTVVFHDTDVFDGMPPAVLVVSSQGVSPTDNQTEAWDTIQSVVGNVATRLRPLSVQPSSAHGSVRRAWLQFPQSNATQFGDHTHAAKSADALVLPGGGRTLAGTLFQQRIKCGVGSNTACPEHIEHQLEQLLTLSGNTPCSAIAGVVPDQSPRWTLVDGTLQSMSSMELFISDSTAFPRSFHAQTSASLKCGAYGYVSVLFVVRSSNVNGNRWPFSILLEERAPYIPFQLAQALQSSTYGEINGFVKVGEETRTFLPGNIFDTDSALGFAVRDESFVGASVASVVARIVQTNQVIHAATPTNSLSAKTSLIGLFPTENARVQPLVAAYLDQTVNPSILGYFTWHPAPMIRVRAITAESLRQKQNTWNLVLETTFVNPGQLFAYGTLASSIKSTFEATIDRINAHTGTCRFSNLGSVDLEGLQVSESVALRITHQLQGSRSGSAWTTNVENSAVDVGGFIDLVIESNGWELSYNHETETVYASQNDNGVTLVGDSDFQCGSVLFRTINVNDAVQELEALFSRSQPDPLILSNWDIDALIIDAGSAINAAFVRRAGPRDVNDAVAALSKDGEHIIKAFTRISGSQVEIHVSTASFHTATLPRARDWEYVLATDRVTMDVVLTGNFVIAVASGQSTVKSYSFKAHSALEHFSIPSSKSLQTGRSLATLFTVDMALPKIEFHMKVDVMTDQGDSPTFVINGTHFGTEDDEDIVVFDIQNFAWDHHASPFQTYTQMTDRVLLMPQRLLEGEMRATIPPLAQPLAQLSQTPGYVARVKSAMSIQPQATLAYATSYSCLPQMREDGDLLLNYNIFEAAKNVSNCSLNTVSFDSIQDFVSTFNNDLRACDLGLWMSMRADTTEAPDNCATFGLFPTTPGGRPYFSFELVASDAESTPKQNLTLFSPGDSLRVPIFNSFRDLLMLTESILTPDSTPREVMSFQIPAAQAGIPDFLQHMYPPTIQGIGFGVSMRHRPLSALSSKLRPTISTNGTTTGRVRAVMDAAAAVILNTDLDCVFTVAFSAVPPAAGRNLTLWTNSQADVTSVVVPEAPNNAFTFIVKGQRRHSASQVERVDVSRRITLASGEPLIEALDAALDNALPAWLHAFVSSTVLHPYNDTVQGGITVTHGQLDDGSWWLPDTLSIVDSTLPMLDDPTLSLPLTRPVVSDLSFNVHGKHRVYETASVELDLSILDAESPGVDGAGTFSLDVVLSEQSKNCTAQGAATCFLSLGGVRKALREESDEFYDIFNSKISTDARLAFPKVQFPAASTELSTDDLAVILSAKASDVVLTKTTQLASVIRDVSFQPEIQAVEELKRTLENLVHIDPSTLCEFVSAVMDTIDSYLVATTTGTGRLPFGQKTLVEWMEATFSPSLRETVHSVCDAGHATDLQAMCNAFRQAFGTDICERAVITGSGMENNIHIDIFTPSTDQFYYDSNVFDPLKSTELSVGESSNGSLSAGVSVTLDIDLLFSLVEFPPKFEITNGKFEASVHLSGQNTIKLWFGPMPVFFANANVRVGPLALTIGFGTQNQQPLAVTGDAALSATVNTPFGQPCNLEVTVPDVVAFIRSPSSDTFHYRAANCRMGISTSLLNALDSFGFSSSLIDFGRLGTQLTRAWRGFLNIFNSQAPTYGRINIPLLSLNWWRKSVSRSLGSVFNAEAVGNLLRNMQSEIVDMAERGAARGRELLEKQALKVFTNGLNELLKDYLKEPLVVPEFVADTRDYKWNLHLGKSYSDTPSTIGFSLGGAGAFSASAHCEQEAQIGWDVVAVLEWSSKNGVRLLFEHDPALHVGMQLDLNDCAMGGAFGVLGADLTLNGGVTATLDLRPPAVTPTNAWAVKPNVQATASGRIMIGGAGWIAQLLDKSNAEAIAALPNARMGMDCNFGCGLGGCSRGPVCNFTEPALCAGSILTQFLRRHLAFTDSNFFQQVVRVSDVLQTRVAVGRVIGRDLRVVDFMKWAVDLLCDGECVFDNVFEALDSISRMVQTIADLAHLARSFQDDNCEKAFVPREPFTLDFSGDVPQPADIAEAMIHTPIEFQGATAEQMQIVTKSWNNVEKAGEFSVTMPFLKRKYVDTLVDLLMDRPVVLVRADFPRMNIDFGASIEIPIWPLPYVAVELGFSAGISFRAPPLLITSHTAQALFKSGNIGNIMRSMALETRDPETQQPVTVLAGRLTVSGGVSVGVNFWIASGTANFGLTLTLELEWNMPQENDGMITIGEFFHLVDINGNVFAAMQTRVKLSLGIYFNIRVCVRLLFKRFCWTIVSWNTNFLLWSFSFDPRTFIPPVTAAGHINLDAASDLGPSRGQCRGDCVSHPTFTLFETDDNLDVSLQMPTLGMADAPRQGRTAAAGDCLHLTGSGPSSPFEVELRGVSRCIIASPNQHMHVRVPQASFSFAKEEEPTARRRRRSLLMRRDLSDGSGDANSTDAATLERPRLLISPMGVVPDRTSGLLFTEWAHQSCNNLNVTEPTANLLVHMTGTPCETFLHTDMTQLVHSQGDPSAFTQPVSLVGIAGRLNLRLGGRNIRVSGAQTTVDEAQFNHPNPPMQTFVHTSMHEDSFVTITDVDAAADVTVVGGKGTVDFHIPDLMAVDGGLTLDATVIGINTLGIHTAVPEGKNGTLSVTPSSISAFVGSEFSNVMVNNLDTVNMTLTTHANANSRLTMIQPDPFTALSVRSISHLGATSDTIVPGCPSPTSHQFVQLEGDGYQRVLIGSGDLTRFNCFVRVMGHPNSTTQTDTIIINAESDPRDLLWTFNANSILMLTTSSADVSSLQISFEDVNRVIVKFGTGSNAVVIAGSDPVAEFVLEFPDELPEGQRPNLIQVQSVTRAMMVVGQVDVQLARDHADDYEPLLAFASTLFILNNRDLTHTRLVAGVGAEPQHLLLHGRCISRVDQFDPQVTPESVLTAPTDWFKTTATEHGWVDDGTDLAHCHVYNPTTAQYALHLTNGADSVYVVDVEFDTTISARDGDDVVHVEHADALTLHLDLGNGADAAVINYPILNSTVQFGSDKDFDTLYYYLAGSEARITATSIEGTDASGNASVQLDAPRVDDVTYVIDSVTTRVQRSSSHARRRGADDTRAVPTRAASWWTHPLPIPAQSRVVQVDYQEADKRVYFSLGSGITLHVTAVHDGTLVSVTSLEGEHVTGWQVWTDLVDYDRTGVVEVGPRSADEDVSVGFVAPALPTTRVNVTQTSDVTSTLTYARFSLRFHLTRHFVVYFAESGTVHLNKFPFGAETVVAASGLAELTYDTLNAPLLVHNTKVAADLAALRGITPSLYVVGEHSAVTVDASMYNMVELDRACGIVSINGSAADTSTPSSWLDAWVQALTPAHASQFGSCNLFFSGAGQVTLHAEELSLIAQNEHITNLVFDGSLVNAVGDDKTMTAVTISDNKLAATTDDSEFTMTMMRTATVNMNNALMESGATLSLPCLCYNTTGGAYVAPSTVATWHLSAAQMSKGRVTFSSPVCAGSLTGNVVRDLVLDAQVGLMSEEAANATHCAVGATLGLERDAATGVEAPTNDPALPAAAHTLVVDETTVYSSSTVEATIVVGKLRDHVTVQVALEEFETKLQLANTTEPWATPMHVEVEEGAKLMWSPVNKQSFRLGHTAARWSISGTFQAQGTRLEDGGVVIHPRDDCSSYAYEARMISHEDTCQATEATSASRVDHQQLPLAFVLHTSLETVCSFNTTQDQGVVGVGYPADGESHSVQHLKLFQGLVLAWYIIAILWYVASNCVNVLSFDTVEHRGWFSSLFSSTLPVTNMMYFHMALFAFFSLLAPGTSITERFLQIVNSAVAAFLRASNACRAEDELASASNVHVVNYAAVALVGAVLLVSGLPLFWIKSTPPFILTVVSLVSANLGVTVLLPWSIYSTSGFYAFLCAGLMVGVILVKWFISAAWMRQPGESLWASQVARHLAQLDVIPSLLLAAIALIARPSVNMPALGFAILSVLVVAVYYGLAVFLVHSTVPTARRIQKGAFVPLATTAAINVGLTILLVVVMRTQQDLHSLVLGIFVVWAVALPMIIVFLARWILVHRVTVVYAGDVDYSDDMDRLVFTHSSAASIPLDEDLSTDYAI
eukprot:m.251675 g.251675  ORF g.251675 m.251675 type:complete len:4236 (+) comp15458_c0_seq1:94-12801(+)